MVTKVGAGLWSATPTVGGFRSADVTAAATAATATRAFDADHAGSAVIAGYTVGHFGGAPSDAVIVADTPDGRRALARTADPDLVEALRIGEWCGRSIEVRGAELLALAD
jgi:acetyl-CoA C-acetyltransferase